MGFSPRPSECGAAKSGASFTSFFNLRDSCFFQLFFWRACSSSCALLVIVCISVFFMVLAAFEPFVFVGATPIFSSY